MIDATSLWTAVLRQAIFDLTGLRLRMKSAYRPGQRAGKAHQARYFARLWFLSDNHQPCSFNWICDHLDLDAPSFRRRLFAIVDGAPNGVERIPVQLEGLLAEEEKKEGIGADSSAWKDGII